MITRKFIVLLICCCLASINGYGASKKSSGKKRILVVSSYHREYHWSRETNAGFCDALLKFGYFDNRGQIAEFGSSDYVETSRVVVKKLWMDAKRKNSKSEKETMRFKIVRDVREFNPEIIFLGDDDAAEYIGKEFLDAEIPVVFWGLNNTPLKYGLVDSEKRPGHNVTGVYQSGYYLESLRLLKKIAPHVKTFAVLTVESSTGRSHYKEIEYLSRQRVLPLVLMETVSTESFEVWQEKALELQKKVDAFFVAHYAGMKDRAGNYVAPEDAAKWYTDHITIPEAVEFRGFVEQGMLCGADDSGYNQGYEAVVIAHDILTKDADPATYPPRAPKRGALSVNINRAAALGIKLTPDMGIEEYIDKASAISDGQKKGREQ